ncbi:MAG TPA: hypothetical protein GX520_06615 [Syntrophaceticus sp.]|nr:hypothetical protein [Syntrophaceticus sp.]
MHDIIFYEDKNGHCPFLAFTGELTQKNDQRSRTLAKSIFLKLTQLKQNGTMDGMPNFEYIQDSKYPLWQIRIKHVTGTYRVFFCPWEGKYVILNHFIKKSKKTPKKEIRKAER